jgi:thiamine-phosphate pyrophosphorylase
MLVTDRRRTRGRELVPLVAEAVRGGVGIVLIREGDLPAAELAELVRRIRQAVPARTQLVAHGSLEVARAERVGLHLPARAPALGAVDLGGRLFGRSVHDDEELRAALAEPVTHVLAGTIFPTAGKPGRPPGGLALLERICRQAGRVPVFAIGGITVSRVSAARHAGAHGVAVWGAILAAREPRRVAEAMDLALRVAARALEAD